MQLGGSTTTNAWIFLIPLVLALLFHYVEMPPNLFSWNCHLSKCFIRGFNSDCNLATTIARSRLLGMCVCKCVCACLTKSDAERLTKLFYWNHNHLSETIWTEITFSPPCYVILTSADHRVMLYRQNMSIGIFNFCVHEWRRINHWRQTLSIFSLQRMCIEWQLSATMKSMASYREENCARSLPLNQCNALCCMSHTA